MIKKLSPNMTLELQRTAQGKGRYWPNGKGRLSLRGLARRRLVEFRLGYGWSLTADGEIFLGTMETQQ